MAGKQVTELDALPSFTDDSLLPVHNGAGLKKGLLSQLSNYLGTKFSNPNLLINPDFKINQRGETSYTSAVAQTIKIVYSVDRWCLYGHSLTVNSDKSVTITPTTYSDGALIQNLETPVDGDITVQVYAVGVSGTATVSVRPFDDSSNAEIGTLKNGLNTFTFSKGIKRLVIRVKSGTLTLKYAKVEQGKVATSFVAPNPAEELVKCARFLQIKQEIHFVPYASTRAVFSSVGRNYQSTDGLFQVEMRTKPTITYSNIHKANGEVISERVTGIDSNKYGIATFSISNDADYYTLRMKNVIADAEMY